MLLVLRLGYREWLMEKKHGWMWVKEERLEKMKSKKKTHMRDMRVEVIFVEKKIVFLTNSQISLVVVNLTKYSNINMQINMKWILLSK